MDANIFNHLNRYCINKGWDMLIGPDEPWQSFRLPPKGRKKVTFDLLEAPLAENGLPPRSYTVSVNYSRSSSSEEVVKSLRATSNTITVEVIPPKPGGKE